MIAQPSRYYMTVDEWRDLERTSHDIRHEYIDGRVYAMAGGTLAHAYIADNVLVALRVALRDKTCRAYRADVAARLSPTRYTYPDVVVSCDEHDRPTTALREIGAPRIAIEVLSKSTESYDKGEKFSYYRACPSLQEYAVIATRYQLVEVYRRTQEGWTEFHVYGPGDEVELTSIAVHLPIALLYELTDVPETFDTPEGEI
jgi:Uma2 family endonuclease